MGRVAVRVHADVSGTQGVGRRWGWCVAVLLLLALPLQASETPAEHAANVYAAQELAAAPAYGNVPDYSLPAQKLRDAQHLERIEVTTYAVGVIWGIAQLALLLWLGAIAWMRDRAVGLGRSRWVQGFAFLLLLLVAQYLLDLPLSMYAHHLSRVYGFSVQGWASWFWDGAKGLGVGWLLGGLLVMLLFWTIRRLPRRWWLAFWVATIPVILFSEFAAPYVIEPLFNHYEPLARSHPELVQRLEQVAARGHMNIPPERMFLMRASDKVTTLNAYVSGFGSSKRVVVWDTSLKKATPDEVLFIFGHESGHYVLGHVVLGTVVAIPVLLVLLYLGYRFVGWALARFGARWGIASQEDWGTLAVLLLAFAIFSAVLEPLSHAASRRMEHAADVYGQEAVHGIIADPQSVGRATFALLGENSDSDPNPGRLYEIWMETHPTLGRRAAFAAAYDPWAPGMAPKYFAKH